MARYFYNLCVAFDQLANVICAGYPDETLSSRAYRQSKNSLFWCCVMHCINALFFNKSHCHDAFYKEIDLPKEYKKSWDKKY